MRHGLRLALAPLLASAALLCGAQPAADPVGPDGLLQVPALARVVDQPHVLGAPDRAALEARLAAFEADNGAQVAIVIVGSTGIEPVEDFANRVGSAWKIGRHGVGDGLLLVLATRDHAARIEVARSLEGAIPDAIAKRVIVQSMAPHFRAGDYAGGLNAALDDLLPRIGQEKLAPPAQRAQGSGQRGPGLDRLLPLLLVGAAFGSALRRALGAGGALFAGAGAGILGAVLLTSALLGTIVGVVVFALAMAMGAGGRYGHAIGGGPWFPGGWGGGSGGGFGGGGFSGGGGGFSSGGGGDFSGGGASGSW